MRTNGAVRFAIVEGPDCGLPYGPYPRLILLWIATEAVRKQSRHIDLHLSLNGEVAVNFVCGPEFLEPACAAARSDAPTSSS